MKLEIGKYYRTRDGRKAHWDGSMHKGFAGVQVEGDPELRLYNMNGRHYDTCGLDLIAEWSDEPNEYQPTYEECMDAAYAKGMEYTPTETGTLAELNVKTGDVVEAQWIGESTWHKYVYTENHPTLGQPCVMGSSGSYILVRDAHLWIWRTVSQPSPVRTVTRKEIVPGVYGRLVIEKNCADQFCIHIDRPRITWQKDQLTAAIETLTKIRDALA